MSTKLPDRGGDGATPNDPALPVVAWDPLWAMRSPATPGALPTVPGLTPAVLTGRDQASLCGLCGIQPTYWHSPDWQWNRLRSPGLLVHRQVEVTSGLWGMDAGEVALFSRAAFQSVEDEALRPNRLPGQMKAAAVSCANCLTWGTTRLHSDLLQVWEETPYAQSGDSPHFSCGALHSWVFTRLRGAHWAWAEGMRKGVAPTPRPRLQIWAANQGVQHGGIQGRAFTDFSTPRARTKIMADAHFWPWAFQCGKDGGHGLKWGCYGGNGNRWMSFGDYTAYYGGWLAEIVCLREEIGKKMRGTEIRWEDIPLLLRGGSQGVCALCDTRFEQLARAWVKYALQARLVI